MHTYKSTKSHIVAVRILTLVARKVYNRHEWIVQRVEWLRLLLTNLLVFNVLNMVKGALNTMPNDAVLLEG